MRRDGDRRGMPDRRPKRSPGARKGAGGHGGAREGAGRKREVLPADALDRIGPRPVREPLKLASWYSELLAELVDQFVRTGRFVAALREVKGAAAAMGRVMPMEVLLAATRKLKADEDDLHEDEDPTEEVREPDGSRPRAVRRDAP